MIKLSLLEETSESINEALGSTGCFLHYVKTWDWDDFNASRYDRDFGQKVHDDEFLFYFLDQISRLKEAPKIWQHIDEYMVEIQYWEATEEEEDDQPVYEYRYSNYDEIINMIGRYNNARIRGEVFSL